MLRRRHSRQPGALDFTSLVDIALVLVVFFVLTSQTIEMRSLPVALPAAGTADAAATAPLEVVVDAGGALTCRGRPLQLKELAAQVGGATRATVLADTQARHGRVVEVVDALRHAGVAEVYFATKTRVEDW